MATVTGARSRLAWALGVSVLLHVWLVQHAQGLLGSPRATLDGGVPLAAPLQPIRAVISALPVPVDFPVQTLDPDLAAAVHQPVRTAVAAASVTSATSAPAAADVTQVTIAAAPRAPSMEPSPALAAVDRNRHDTALPQPRDATYYGALSLDAYPKALTALELTGWMTGGAGQVRATVLIDESGVVNAVRDVRTMNGAEPELAEAARALLLQTRFTPARKDGRMVKAEVRVNLSYGAR